MERSLKTQILLHKTILNEDNTHDKILLLDSILIFNYNFFYNLSMINKAIYNAPRNHYFVKYIQFLYSRR